MAVDPEDGRRPPSSMIARDLEPVPRVHGGAADLLALGLASAVVIAGLALFSAADDGD